MAYHLSPRTTRLSNVTVTLGSSKVLTTSAALPFTIVLSLTSSSSLSLTYKRIVSPLVSTRFAPRAADALLCW